jgi:hypothetical protein
MDGLFTDYEIDLLSDGLLALRDSKRYLFTEQEIREVEALMDKLSLIYELDYSTDD